MVAWKVHEVCKEEPSTTKAQIKALKIQEPESSDEYELASNNEEVDQEETPQETTTQKGEDASKNEEAAKIEQEAKDTLIAIQEFVKEAKEDEDRFERRY
jgi:hypothetical protein